MHVSIAFDVVHWSGTTWWLLFSASYQSEFEKIRVDKLYKYTAIQSHCSRATVNSISRWTLLCDSHRSYDWKSKSTLGILSCDCLRYFFKDILRRRECAVKDDIDTYLFRKIYLFTRESKAESRNVFHALKVRREGQLLLWNSEIPKFWNGTFVGLNI